jgi:1-acyl-sn-glycerol-3-phosphate acyltransferase
LIAACFPRQVRYVAKKELFSVPIISSVIRTLGAIRMDRKGNDVVALRSCTQLAKLGEAVAIFPQGHRYPGVHPATTPIKNGAAMIAHRAGVDVIPVSLRAKTGRVRPFSKVLVTVGKPIPRSLLDTMVKEDGSPDYKAQTAYIFEQICALYDAQEV